MDVTPQQNSRHADHARPKMQALREEPEKATRFRRVSAAKARDELESGDVRSAFSFGIGVRMYPL